MLESSLTAWLVRVVMVGVGRDGEGVIGRRRGARHAFPLLLLLLDVARCFQQRLEAHLDGVS